MPAWPAAFPAITPMEALYAANDASSSSSLHPGQSLCLPEIGFGRGLRNTLLSAAPVRGACRFANSWMAARGGRFHVGVDLISPSGTPVVAAASGTLTRQTKDGARSGNAWWLTTASGTDEARRTNGWHHTGDVGKKDPEGFVYIVDRKRDIASIEHQYYSTVRPMHVLHVAPSKRHAHLVVPEGGENAQALDVIVGRLKYLLLGL